MKKKELGVCNLGNTWLRKEKPGMIIGFNYIDIHFSMWKLQRRGVWLNSLLELLSLNENMQQNLCDFQPGKLYIMFLDWTKGWSRQFLPFFFLSKILWFLIMLQLKMMMQIYIYWHGKMPMTYCWWKIKQVLEQYVRYCYIYIKSCA